MTILNRDYHDDGITRKDKVWFAVFVVAVVVGQILADLMVRW